MPSFQNPAAFLLLILIPILFLLRKMGFFSKISFVITLSDWDGESFSWNDKLRKFVAFFVFLFTILGYVAAVTALAGPIIYKQERVYTSRGTDILFVLDISPSMAAQDMNGSNRLETAKNAINYIVENNTGASFGVVAMAAESAVVVPPTMDHTLFLQRMNDIPIGNLGDGTAIGVGLSTAIYHLAASSAPKKCIVLITDGENNAGAIHPETAAELAASQNITLYTLGVGSKGSAPIEYIDPKTNKKYSGYLTSSFDSTQLKLIASIANGRYFEAQTLNDLSLALLVITKNESTVQTYHSRTTSVEYYDKLIFISGAFLVLAWILRRLYLKEFI